MGFEDVFALGLGDLGGFVGLGSWGAGGSAAELCWLYRSCTRVTALAPSCHLACKANRRQHAITRSHVKPLETVSNHVSSVLQSFHPVSTHVISMASLALPALPSLRSRLLQRMPRISARHLGSARSISPISGQLLRQFPFLPSSAALSAVDESSLAFREWSAAGWEERGALLKGAAALLRLRSSSLALLMADEMGKPVREGSAEVEKCASHLEWYAEQAERMGASEQTEVEGARLVYRPLGPVLAIMPWNFPLWQVFRQAGTALSAGNTVLLKHAPNVRSKNARGTLPAFHTPRCCIAGSPHTTSLSANHNPRRAASILCTPHTGLRLCRSDTADL